MTKQISEKQLSQLKTLKKRCDVTLDFIARKIEDNMERDRIISEVSSIVESAFVNKDLAALRQPSKDIDDWTKGVSAEDLQELEHELQALAGVNTKKEKVLILDKIQKIVDRGEIKNIREYQLLLDRVEAIYADDLNSDEVQKVNKWLAHYD